jgi:hypothetical protein
MPIDTLEVAREFLKKTEELAEQSKIPEIRARLMKLADQYNQKIEALESENAEPR